MDIILVLWLLLVGVMSALSVVKKLQSRQAQDLHVVPVVVSLRRHGSSRGV